MEEDKVHSAVGLAAKGQGQVSRLRHGEQSEPKERPRVGLALAGGFARGIAHIGVLRVLSERRHSYRLSSQERASGALIGAIYCAGVPLYDMQRIAADTTFADFGRWTPSWLGLATNLRMERYFGRFTMAKTFEELHTPLAIATSDINAGVPSTTRVARLAPRCAVRARILGYSCPFNSKDAR